VRKTLPATRIRLNGKREAFLNLHLLTL